LAAAQATGLLVQTVSPETSVEMKELDQWEAAQGDGFVASDLEEDSDDDLL